MICPVHPSPLSTGTSPRLLLARLLRARREHLWPHVWQMACRLEIEPGDFVSTGSSTSRSSWCVDADTIKAYFNACRHRATSSSTTVAIVAASSARSTAGAGTSTVPTRSCTKPSCSRRRHSIRHLHLVECQATWGSAVREHGTAPRCASFGFSCSTRQRGRCGPPGGSRPCFNWKLAMEAFFEGYHIMNASATAGAPRRRRRRTRTSSRCRSSMMRSVPEWATA